jgi:hypothetical protein
MIASQNAMITDAMTHMTSIGVGGLMRPPAAQPTFKLVFTDCQKHNCTDEYCDHYQLVISTTMK